MAIPHGSSDEHIFTYFPFAFLKRNLISVLNFTEILHFLPSTPYFSNFTSQCEVCRHFFEDTFEDTFGDTFEDTFNDFSRLYMVLITFGDTFNSFCRHFYV